ncbi:hypothetical protein LOD99_13026 [Oopsacas minuta]|uniref:Superoxide dismutase n=1 Tax=Oopsacas minuta TaxID=111878 RepID=A0AAV7JAP9_9METZ|nr:hypothetical protein LOD99_13026 [Oopsacas minuta]
MFGLRRLSQGQIFTPRLTLCTLRAQHTLPDLPYPYESLEPHISAEIMRIHHTKHHATYVKNLNAAEQKINTAVDAGDLSGIIALQGAVKFNGGGHINHSIFWSNLSPNGGGEPQGDLRDAINKEFGSFSDFQSKFVAAATGVQGSGWSWLGYNRDQKRLQIASCPNQDPLQATTGLIPLLGIDVWEHAYYLQYKNVRPGYLKAIWNVINWNNISERLLQVK